MKQWDKIFKWYGRVFTKPQEDIPGIIKLLRKKGVKRVLDLGCGSGRHTVYLAMNGFEVYGLDIAPEGIAMTKKWLKKEDLRANLKVGSVYKKLPYRDRFFDAIISTQTIHHGRIEDIRKLIKEIKRVLRPNGIVFITVSKKGPKRLISEKIRWKIKFIAPRTFIPLSHEEKGLVHYWFNKTILRNEFSSFKIDGIWTESNGKHYCLLANLKFKGKI